MRGALLGLTLVLVGGLVAGCAGTPSTGGSEVPTVQPGSPSAVTSTPPSPTPGAADGRQAVPVYYISRSRAGDRLYREFHRVPAGEPGSAAVRELLATTNASDPDYRSEWPPGWQLRAPVTRAGGVITVDLTPPTGAAPPKSAELARLAVQQLVYTVQGALGSADPVRILLDGRSGGRLFDQVPIAAPVTRADPTAVRCLVQIDNPAEGAVTGRTVRVSGEAAVFEAHVSWEVLRGGSSGGAVVQRGYATAAEAFRFTPYAFTVTLEPGEYVVRVFEVDESGGEGRPPFEDTKRITVR